MKLNIHAHPIQVFPPVSKLDPAIYGPSESAITEQHIAGNLNGMTVEQVTENKISLFNPQITK